MQLADMTRAQLHAAMKRADKLHSKACDAMIAAGRGHELPSETLRKDDALSLQYRAAAEATHAAYGERTRRLAWQGTEHRIIKAA